MEKQRKFKVLVIIALIFAIVGLTIGFAAFQRMLKVSSSASVAVPTEEDFDVKIYGINSEESLEMLSNTDFDISKASKETSVAFDYVANKLNFDYVADIDNDNFTININKVNFSEEKYYFYYFVLKNNSAAATYVYLSDVSKKNFDNNLKECVAGENASEKLVGQACDDINYAFITADLNEFLDGKAYLPPHGYFMVAIVIAYSDKNIVDGPFDVNFPPIQLEFSYLPYEYK